MYTHVHTHAHTPHGVINIEDRSTTDTPVGKELNTGVWKDLAYLIRFWHQIKLFLSQCLGHWLGRKGGTGKDSREPGQEGLASSGGPKRSPKCGREGQAGQPRPRAGLSLQAPEGSKLRLKLELTGGSHQPAKERRALNAVVGAARR